MRSWFVCAIIAVAAVGRPAAAQIPAFSGAEGPGATATGGRGGDVYHVTNLEFDLNGVIPGSLKYGINSAPATGRTIVFDVGGTIYQPGGGSQYWFRSGKSNLTIAGQTAPGGITIAGTGSKWTGDNIILRNITVRPNQDPVNPTSFTYDGVSTQATNSIIDHVTSTWHTDEGISATDAVNNTTVQYSLIAEGLNYNGHSYGAIINTQNSDAPLAYHHNVFASNNSRMPRLGSETGTGAVTNFYNNVIYNWVSRAGYSALNTDTGAEEPSRTNFINNFYARGASRGTTIFLSAGPATQIYQSGNLYDGTTDADFNDAVAVTWSHFTGTETQAATPFAVAGGVIDATTAGRDRALAFGGANWWERNAIDQRILDQVVAGTNIMPTTVPAADWAAVLAAPLTSRPAGWDTDGDGMPDGWEAAHGLNPAVADNNGDFDTDGYTNLEEYVNELAAWPAPRAIVFSGAANNRYAQIQNWDIGWQPSRYDTAVINQGTAVVDAVGQHAGNVLLGTNPGDNATLNVTGGWLVVENADEGLSDGVVAIGDNPAATATLNLSGGMLRTDALLKGPGGAFNFTGGVLSADVVGFDLVNDGGVIAPGLSPGGTHVLGDLTINGGGLQIELAGAGAGQFDQLVVDGAATLGGILDVSLLDGFQPELGQFFPVVTGVGGIFFDFDEVHLPALAGGNALRLVYGETIVGLEVVAALPGDFNGDGKVDGSDLLALQRDPGLGELADWQANFGAGFANSAAAVVPEPGAATLFSLALLGAAFRCRRIHELA